jgi:hypothetical protein
LAGFLGIASASAAAPLRHSAVSGNIPPSVLITCPQPSSLSEYVTIPRLVVGWQGDDPDGPGGLPVEYKHLLLGPGSEFPVSQAIADPNSLRDYYANHPNGPWAGWDSTGAGDPSAEFTNLPPDAHYLFVVVAFDEAGDYSPTFDLTTNMLQFRVSYIGYLGPVITLSGPGLDYRYPSGGYCPCPSAEVPVDIGAGLYTTFRWSAVEHTACGDDSVVAYRWALDIEDVSDQTPRTDEATDLTHWSAPSLMTTSATLPPFPLTDPPGTHRLYIEAQDHVGVKSLGIILMTVVDSPTGEVRTSWGSIKSSYRR